MVARTKSLVVCLCFGGLLWGAENGVWLDVPFVSQGKNGCGAASIAMVMQYWQRQQGQVPSADAKQIQQRLYSSKAHGIYAPDLKRYFAEHGFRTFVFRGQWTDLKEHLEKGRPLVVALKPSGQAEFHYLVVAGFDGVHGLVLTNDPAERKLLKRERLDFEKEWKATGNWTLLAVPQRPDTGPSSD